MNNKELNKLIKPLKIKEKFLTYWYVEEIKLYSNSDILINLRNIKNNNLLIIWLTKRKKKHPTVTFTKSFNITYISKQVGHFTKNEKEVFNYVVGLIEKNDQGKTKLISKKNPDVLVLQKDKDANLAI